MTADAEERGGVLGRAPLRHVWGVQSSLSRTIGSAAFTKTSGGGPGLKAGEESDPCGAGQG